MTVIKHFLEVLQHLKTRQTFEIELNAILYYEMIRGHGLKVMLGVRLTRDGLNDG